MSSHAVASKPYWRWLRFHRTRGTFRRGKGAIAKPWNGLVLAAILVAVDALTKTQMTQLFPPHAQPKSWLIGPAILLAVTLPLMLVPRVWLGASLGIAGLIGNGQSVLFDGAAPNPFMYASGSDIVAFNVADVCLLLATFLVIAGSIRLVLDTRRQTQ